MFEGWLGGLFNDSLPEGVWTISYIIPHTFLYWIKSITTVAVTVCRFRIFTIEQIILNPVTVVKHFVVFTVLEDSYVVIFAKTTAHRNQILQRATMLVFQYSGPLRCQLTYYAKLRPPWVHPNIRAIQHFHRHNYKTTQANRTCIMFFNCDSC